MQKKLFFLALVLLFELFFLSQNLTFAQVPELSFPAPISTDKIDVISPPQYFKARAPIKVVIKVKDLPQKVELLAKPLTSPMLFWVAFFSKTNDTFEATFDPKNFPNGKYQLVFLVTLENESYLGAGPQIEIDKSVPRDEKIIKQLEKELDRIKREVDRVKNEIEGKKARVIYELKKYIDEACAGDKIKAKKEVEEKFNGLVEALGKKYKAEREIGKLKKEMKKLADLRDKKVQEIREIEKRIQNAKPEVKKMLEKQRDEKDKIVDKLENELKDLQDKIDDLQNEINEYPGKIESLKNEIINIISELPRWKLSISFGPGGVTIKWECLLQQEAVEADIKKILKDAANHLSQKYARFFELDEKLQEDFDEDNLSNLKEVEIGTDPFNPDSDWDGFLDGIEVALGFDPKKPSPADKMVAQDPRAVEALDFEIVSIENLEIVTLPTGKSALKFQGRGFKNSFGILHVFSLPLVLSVKVDSNGNWEYILENPLSPGEHFSYIVFANNSGEIISRSEAFYFFLSAGEISEVIPGSGKKSETPSQGKTSPKEREPKIKPPEGETSQEAETGEKEKVAIFPYKIDIYQVTIFVAVFFVIILILGGYYIFSQRH